MDDLKYLALTYVSLNEELSAKQKKEIVLFIVEADEDQISNLLVEGELIEGFAVIPDIKNLVVGSHPYSGIMSVDQLQNAINTAIKRAGEIGKSQGFTSGEEAGFGIGVQTGGVYGFAAAAIAALVIAVSYKVYKRFLSKAARACKRMAGVEKDKCMNKYREAALKMQIAELSKGVAVCNKSKKPDKCKANINSKILRLKGKLGATK